MSPTTAYQVTLELDSPVAVEAVLDRIIDGAIKHTIAHPGHGILVTRCAPGTFTVQLSDEVPQGTIVELDVTRG